MSILRHAKSRDTNEGSVFAVLRAAGYAVFPLDVPCDALAAKRGRVHCVEIKNPDRGKVKLTPMQVKFVDLWAGKGCIHIGTSGVDILSQIRFCERS